MDYGTYRGVYTLIVLVVFIGIGWWAFSKHSKKRFDNAANSILDDSDLKNSGKEEQQVHRD